MNRHVTIKEVACVLDCSTKTVRRKVDRGLIPAIQPEGKGTHLRFDLDDVLRAVKCSRPNLLQYGDEAESGRTELQDKKLSGPIPKWMRNPKSMKGN